MSALRNKVRKFAAVVVLLAFAFTPFETLGIAGLTASAAAPAVKTEVDYLADVYDNLQPGHVFVSTTYEYANTILNLDDNKNYAFVFGGPENPSTQAAIGYIDEVAKQYGIETVYHFDPKLDGDRLDITRTDSGIPDEWKQLWSAATGAGDASAGGSGIGYKLKNIDPGYTSDSTYVFVYNKSHTDAESNPAPVVAGYVSTAASFDSAQAQAYKQHIADVFETVANPTTHQADIAAYPFFNYFQKRINGVIGSGYESVQIPDSVRDGFAIQTVTYPELIHLLQSDGDFAIFFGGTWCPYTSPTDNIANSAAIRNGVRKVYQFDLRLDGRYSSRSIKSGPFSYLYGRIVNQYLTNLKLEDRDPMDPVLYYPNGDTQAQQQSALSIGVPFLLEYNKNRTVNGNAAPVASEWIGYAPKSKEYFAYAWYTKNNVRDYLADPAYQVKQLGRNVDPDVDNVIDNGANSVTLALPALNTFFSGVAANRTAADPWDYTPVGTPPADSVPDPSGGCGSSGEIDPTVESPILGQNGNAGYDVQHYDIDADYSEPLGTQPGSLSATTTIQAKALKDLQTVSFDLRDLNVTDVEVNGTDAASYDKQNDDTTDTHKLVVTPASAISSGSDFTVKVEYWTHTNSYRFADGSTQGFVPSTNSTGATAIGEPNGSAFWFPSNNNTTDRATYDISLTSPVSLAGVSNGVLESREVHGTTVTRNWKQTQETIPYLVFASFGDYVEFYQTITLSDGTQIPSWSYVDKTLYEQSSDAKDKAYRYAANLQSYIRWAESRVGKYPGTTVGFVFENLGKGEDHIGWSLETVGRPVFAGIPDTSTFVHEFLHQWFGDSVSISKWEDLWLNEGFASFLSNVYFEDTDDSTATTSDWYAQWFADNHDSDYWYLAPTDPKNVHNLFGNATYGRGAYALAALRAEIGDENFFSLLKEWAVRKAGKAVTTTEFTDLAEEVSQLDLDAFFQPWLYGTSKPASFPTAEYGISLSPSGSYTFPAAAAGYGVQAPYSVTVNNTGNRYTGALTVALSGAGSDSFTLSKGSIASIATGGSDSFTVQPKAGLAAGTYAAKVTVSGANGISAAFDVGFTVKAENPAPTYGVSLFPSGAHAFPAATAGYAAQAPYSVTVSNTGNQPTGKLAVALSGADSGSFTLSKASIGSIAAGGSDSFTVQPKAGLAAGSYAAKVTVSGANGISAAFDVSFTVKAAGTAPTYGISLSPSGAHAFPAAAAGYGAQAPYGVTVSNTGNQPTGKLAVALSGANGGSFTLSKASIGSIAAGGSDSFTVQPKAGLAVGSYAAKVTVSGANGIIGSFDVSFTVNRIVHPVLSAFAQFTGGSGNVSARINADSTAFVRLLLNGHPVDSSNYTVTSGSTVITLKDSYLKTLPNGTYSFVAEFTDGSTPLTLRVNVPASNSDTENSGDTDSGTDNTDNTNDQNGTDGASPATGDGSSSPLWLWLGLGSALLALAGLTAARKRHGIITR